MLDYFERKKRESLIFTKHNIDPKLPYDSITKNGHPVQMPGEVSWWSHLSSRYRTAEEQNEFIKSGCIDKKLPPIHVDES